MREKQQRIFVTGAGSGIGYEICRQFAEEGHIIGLNSLEADCQKAVDQLNDQFSQSAISAWPGNIATVPKLIESIHDFSSIHNGLDVFIANAGITIFKSFENVHVEAFDQLMAVNMRGTYFGVQAAAKEMINHKISGRIILISSVCGVQAHRNTSAYGMTKAAIIQLAKSLSEELGDYGITVNVIAPGATLCERTLEDPNYQQGWADVAPGRTVCRPEDVAHTARFLADRRSQHITGETIMLDGGWTVTSPLPKHLKDKLK